MHNVLLWFTEVRTIPSDLLWVYTSQNKSLLLQSSIVTTKFYIYDFFRCVCCQDIRIRGAHNDVIFDSDANALILFRESIIKGHIKARFNGHYHVLAKFLGAGDIVNVMYVQSKVVAHMVRVQGPFQFLPRRNTRLQILLAPSMLVLTQVLVLKPIFWSSSFMYLTEALCTSFKDILLTSVHN